MALGSVQPRAAPDSVGTLSDLSPRRDPDGPRSHGRRDGAAAAPPVLHLARDRGLALALRRRHRARPLARPGDVLRRRCPGKLGDAAGRRPGVPGRAPAARIRPAEASPSRRAFSTLSPPRFVRRCWWRCSCRRPPPPGFRARARDGRPGRCGLRPQRWCRSSRWRPSAGRRRAGSRSRPSTGGSAFSARSFPGPPRPAGSTRSCTWPPWNLACSPTRSRLRRSTWRLSWDEARRRWRFHAFRAGRIGRAALGRERGPEPRLDSRCARRAASGDGGDGGGAGARGSPPPSRRALPDLGLFLGGDSSRTAPKGPGNARRRRGGARRNVRSGRLLAARAPHGSGDRPGAAGRLPRRGRPRRRRQEERKDSDFLRRPGDRGDAFRSVGAPPAPGRPKGRTACRAWITFPSDRGRRRRVRRMRRRSRPPDRDRRRPRPGRRRPDGGLLGLVGARRAVSAADSRHSRRKPPSSWIWTEKAGSGFRRTAVRSRARPDRPRPSRGGGCPSPPPGSPRRGRSSSKEWETGRSSASDW